MSLSLILPLNIGGAGFESFDDSETRAAIQQNLRMLLLTAPGEYVMDPNFGVGLRNYLFEPASNEVGEIIKSEIIKQTASYMPYININKINLSLEEIDSNILSISINYTTVESVLQEILEMTITS